MIKISELKKSYFIHEKEPGLLGSVRSLFHRKWIEKEALKGVSFQVNAGEIVGLIGSNGAGKTTLVKCLSGIVHPTSGGAEVLGFDPWKRPKEFRKQIALIMGQKAQLWWDLPAADCFLLLKDIYQIPDATYKKNLSYLIDTLKVSNQLKTQVRRLSLGERMKMELIAALLHSPKVVFLDEPTIGLDLSVQKAIRNFLLEYGREHQPAMILTSHYMEDIESLCERIVMLREGEIIYEGSLKKIHQEYSQHKLIRFFLEKSCTEAELKREFPNLEFVSKSETEITVRIKKEQTAHVVSEVFSKMSVKDISIEEEDVGVVIEAIMRRGSL